MNLRQHQLPERVTPPSPKRDHLQAHRAHMRNVKFSQRRGHWSRLNVVVTNWNNRLARKEVFSRHEQAMYEAANAELKLVEDQLDQMMAEAEAEITAEQERLDEEKAARDAAGKPSVADVDPFEHQKRREVELREAAKK